MKTHWISEISYARTTRKRHHITGPWYTYAKQQANRQVRRNAQFYISEGLDEVYFGLENDRVHTEWERREQIVLMDSYQYVLRAALNFACRSLMDVDDHNSYYDCCEWYNTDDALVAYSEWTGISVVKKHHDFVWNVFKLFL